MRDLLELHYGAMFEPELLEEITHVAVMKEFKEGDVLIDFGQYIQKMPLLLEGAIKILIEDTCAMTMACCLGETKSEIRAVAETKGLLLMIPVIKMEDWLGKYKTWRNFVFNSYNQRLKEMLSAIDHLAFMNMNDRLLSYLIDKTKIYQTREIKSTHQEIAYDLHTSRVVISRLLKTLEKEGKIKIHRASIELL